eukprot:scaffold43153_cov66-Phaeocystis_antarctica.AAC.1
MISAVIEHMYWSGTAISHGATSCADSPPPAITACSAFARSAVDMVSSGAAARPAFSFLLDLFRGGCSLTCSAASSTSSSPIAVCTACAACNAIAAGGCGGAACCWMSFAFDRPWALAFRAGRCGRRWRAARCWPGPAVRVRLKATAAIVPSTTDSAIQGRASGNTAQRARPKPGERQACCWISSATAVRPLISAHRRAVRPWLSSSSVLALARSRACTQASCSASAATVKARAAAMRGVAPMSLCKSMLAPRFSSSLTISTWPLVAAACSRAKAEG